MSTYVNKLVSGLLTSVLLLSPLLIYPDTAAAADGEITFTGYNTGLVGDDVGAGPFNLGFAFNYYGTSYTQAYVNINGTITFGSSYSAYSNGALNSSGANNTIYAFWDDLNTQSQRIIYYATVGTAPNRQFVTQWTNIYFHGTSIQLGTFQVILYEGSNNIKLQYRDLLGGARALGNSATIGIKKDNSVYKQYSNDTASLTQGQAILYTPNGSNDYTQNASSTYELVYLAPEGAPTSPTLVNPTDGTTGVTLTPTFEWLPVDSATSYTVLISTVSNFSSTVVNQSGITGTSYTPGSALNQNTNYYWRVQAVNSNGSSLSPTRSFTTGSTNNAPSTPSGVSSAQMTGAASSSSLVGATLTATLSDPDNNEQVRYRLQMATDASFNDLVIDYRSPFGNEGEITYTYGESGGIYLVGSSTTTLPVDSYYLRIRSEDDAAASSAWYTVSGVAFNIVDAPDITPPVISSISVADISTSTARITWSTNEAANSRIDYGTSSSYGNSSTTVSYVTSHSVVLRELNPGTVYHYRVQSEDSASNVATSSDLTFTTENLPDNTAPGISDLSVDPESDSVTVYWTTDEVASSIVEYGPSSSYTASTTEMNLSPRVTNHEVLIGGLNPCVTYHYRVISRDASNNEVVGNDNSFTTKNCVGDAIVTSQTAIPVATSTGGTLDLRSSGKGLSLSIPASFSTSSAHFQIKKVDDTTARTSTGVPSGTAAVGAYTYELHAVTDNFVVIESFDEPITLTLAYGPDDIEGIVETSLKIYRWHNSDWYELPDCVVDTVAKTVTCSTDHFSTFGLFGDEEEASSEPVVSNSSSSSSTGFSIEARVRNLLNSGQVSTAAALTMKWMDVLKNNSNLVVEVLSAYINELRAELAMKGGQSIQQPGAISSSTDLFNRDLWLQDEGDDVKALQQYLIDNGYPIRSGATGYFGEITREALEKFQTDNGIKPSSGYFGELTRAFLLK